MKKLLLPLTALLLAGCATTRTPGPARVQVVAEGRDYQGWSPTRPTCQERPFFPKKRK